MKRNITVSRKAAAPAVRTTHDAGVRRVKVTRTPPASRGRTLYFFQQTPGGNLLRAYMVAMILCQTGRLEAGKPFKLWPYANVQGHLANKRMVRGEGKGVYKLTQSGVNYLTDDRQKPEAETLSGMKDAVVKGVKPAFYKFELSQLTL